MAISIKTNNTGPSPRVPISNNSERSNGLDLFGSGAIELGAAAYLVGAMLELLDSYFKNAEMYAEQNALLQNMSLTLGQTIGRYTKESLEIEGNAMITSGYMNIGSGLAGLGTHLALMGRSLKGFKDTNEKIDNLTKTNTKLNKLKTDILEAPAPANGVIVSGNTPAAGPDPIQMKANLRSRMQTGNIQALEQDEIDVVKNDPTLKKEMTEHFDRQIKDNENTKGHLEAKKYESNRMITGMVDQFTRMLQSATELVKGLSKKEQAKFESSKVILQTVIELLNKVVDTGTQSQNDAIRNLQQVLDKLTDFDRKSEAR